MGETYGLPGWKPGDRQPTQDELDRERRGERALKDLYLGYFGWVDGMGWLVANSGGRAGEVPVRVIANRLINDGYPADRVEAAVQAYFADIRDAREADLPDAERRSRPVEVVPTVRDWPEEPRDGPEEPEVAPPSTRRADRAAFAAERGMTLPAETSETRRHRHLKACLRRHNHAANFAEAALRHPARPVKAS